MNAIQRFFMLWIIVLFSIDAMADPANKELLYIGTQAGLNEGVVTTSQNHLEGTTKKLGYTIDDATAVPAGDFVEVFVGTTGGVNAGVVTPNTNHGGGSTKSIGFLSKKPLVGGTKLYVGEALCNNGVVSDNTMHAGCATHFLGYALPQ
jgi:hypothetical protein